MRSAIITMTLAIGFLFSGLAISQTTETYFIIHKANGKIISKSDNGEKTMVFDFAGFSTKQQVDDLANKIKTLRGVVSITVAENPVDNKWAATAVFYKFANKEYFKYFFKSCGIKYIMIDSKIYSTDNFSEISSQ
jgi:hypothetical protein